MPFAGVRRKPFSIEGGASSTLAAAVEPVAGGDRRRRGWGRHATPVRDDPNRYPGVADEVQFAEGVNIGYRWYDSQGIEPLFPIGHGLSYANIKLKDLAVEPAAGGDGSYTVSVDVRNQSRRTGTEVVQVYVSAPQDAQVCQGGKGTGPRTCEEVRPVAPSDVPPRQLRAFARVTLDGTERQRVELTLDPRDFSYWNERSGDWTVAAGAYTVEVATSSDETDLRLSEEVVISSELHVPASAPVS